MRRRHLFWGLVAVVGAIAALTPVDVYAGAPEPAQVWTPTPDLPCGPGDRPETIQGRIPAADYTSGRAFKGYTCNAEIVARYGKSSSAASGGYRVHRYIDAAGRECAYYDTTLLFPVAAAQPSTELTGVYVLDMTNPRVPVRTANLVTPAMQTPHESFSINQKRGLLAAVMAYPTFQPGVVDVYDISVDCRKPVLKSSTPLGVLGHEGEFSPDGNTYWATSLFTSTITAVDVSDPVVPKLLLTTQNWTIHGLNISDDGTRFYGADTGSDPANSGTDGSNGLTVLDVSDIQNRVANPQIRLVSHLTWKTVSTPQTAIPVTITSTVPGDRKPSTHKYLVEVDEYGSGDRVGAARMINIDDDRNPFVVSNMRLQVHTPEAQAGDEKSDPGEGGTGLQGYRAHYCGVPQRAEPGIVACSMIVSGLRVFDIRDPYKPIEIAYVNQPPAPSSVTGQGGPYAMSQPSFVPERGEIWYSDGNSGFYSVRLTNGVWPFESKRKRK